MEYKKAVKLAVEALRAERRKFIFDANMHRKFGATTPLCLKAHERVLEIDLAIRVLEGNMRLEL